VHIRQINNWQRKDPWWMVRLVLHKVCCCCCSWKARWLAAAHRLADTDQSACSACAQCSAVHHARP
jgi:hypothetical protein